MAPTAKRPTASPVHCGFQSSAISRMATAGGCDKARFALGSGSRVAERWDEREKFTTPWPNSFSPQLLDPRSAYRTRESTSHGPNQEGTQILVRSQRWQRSSASVQPKHEELSAILGPQSGVNENADLVPFESKSCYPPPLTRKPYNPASD